MTLARRSLAGRLFMHFLLIGGSVFSVISLILYLFSINFANLAVEQSMFGMAEDIQENLFFDHQGTLNYKVDNVAEKWGYDALYNNLGFRVIEQVSGQTIYHSAPLSSGNMLLAQLPSDMPIGYSHFEKYDQYRIAFELEHKALYIDLIRSDLLGDLANEAVMPVLSQVTTLTISSAFAVFLVVSYLSVKALVKPVKNVAFELSQIKADQLDRRLSTEGLPDEILPLVQALNSTMCRVEKGFNEQKRFVANAAHELRTPLAVLNTRVELAPLPSEVKTQLGHDVLYMSRVVEQLLDLSRAQNQNKYQHAEVSLNAVAKDVCMLLAPLSITYNKDLELVEKVCDSTVTGDMGALIIMTKNLLENAIKHAQTEALVKLIIDKNTITVMDSGPGINEADRVRIFERFWRKEQSTLTGSGLGLSIVSEVATAHNAHIEVVSKNELGGASFIIHFR